MDFTCPECGYTEEIDREVKDAKQASIPPEPPIGTWVRDRYGATTQRRTYQGWTGWGEPGIMPFGEWRAMWEARGPLVECGPWGEELEEGEK